MPPIGAQFKAQVGAEPAATALAGFSSVKTTGAGASDMAVSAAAGSIAGVASEAARGIAGAFSSAGWDSAATCGADSGSARVLSNWALACSGSALRPLRANPASVTICMVRAACSPPITAVRAFGHENRKRGA